MTQGRPVRVLDVLPRSPNFATTGWIAMEVGKDSREVRRELKALEKEGPVVHKPPGWWALP